MAGSSPDQKRRLVERHFLLGKLSREEIDRLLAHTRVARHPAGVEIFPKGSIGHNMMLVLHGVVRISSLSLDGKEIVLNMIGVGEIFGEIGLLDGLERTADATAMTDCEVLVIERRDFMPLLEAHADMCLILIGILCQRLRRTSEQVEDVLFRHLESRIAKTLLQLARRAGRRDLRLSQRELGNLVGSSRESVNKQLQIWHKEGVIALARGGVVICDDAALDALV
jgi:CRP/FNR family transcriptional regulator, cyclic AMP receptor protein